MSLSLSFACPSYDRILPLGDGRVVPTGIHLNHLSLDVEEIFWRQLRNQEFDISESSLSSYVMLRSKGDDRFVAIPWVHDEIDRTRKIMGEDWWPYGIPRNRKVLETFLRYHYEQGLSGRLMTLEDLFAPETMDEEFKI